MKLLNIFSSASLSTC